MHLAYPRCFVDHSSWTENLGEKMVISLETIERAPRQLSIPIPRSCTSGGIIASVFVNSKHFTVAENNQFDYTNCVYEIVVS